MSEVEPFGGLPLVRQRAVALAVEQRPFVALLELAIEFPRLRHRIDGTAPGLLVVGRHEVARGVDGLARIEVNKPLPIVANLAGPVRRRVVVEEIFGSTLARETPRGVGDGIGLRHVGLIGNIEHFANAIDALHLSVVEIALSDFAGIGACLLHVLAEGVGVVLAIFGKVVAAQHKRVVETFELDAHLDVNCVGRQRSAMPRRKVLHQAQRLERHSVLATSGNTVDAVGPKVSLGGLIEQVIPLVEAELVGLVVQEVGERIIGVDFEPFIRISYVGIWHAIRLGILFGLRLLLIAVYAKLFLSAAEAHSLYFHPFNVLFLENVGVEVELNAVGVEEIHHEGATIGEVGIRAMGHALIVVERFVHLVVINHGRMLEVPDSLPNMRVLQVEVLHRERGRSHSHDGRRFADEAIGVDCALATQADSAVDAIFSLSHVFAKETCHLCARSQQLGHRRETHAPITRKKIGYGATRLSGCREPHEYTLRRTARLLCRFFELHRGLDGAIELGCKRAVERHVRHIPRAHLQLDNVLRQVSERVIRRKIHIEDPPTRIGHDETILAHVVHPWCDIIHKGAVAGLIHIRFLRNNPARGIAISPHGALGQIVGHRNLPHVVVARAEALGHVVENAKNARIFVVNTKEIRTLHCAVTTTVEHPLPAVLRHNFVTETIGNVCLLRATIPR